MGFEHDGFVCAFLTAFVEYTDGSLADLYKIGVGCGSTVQEPGVGPRTPAIETHTYCHPGPILCCWIAEYEGIRIWEAGYGEYAGLANRLDEGGVVARGSPCEAVVARPGNLAAVSALIAAHVLVEASVAQLGDGRFVGESEMNSADMPCFAEVVAVDDVGVPVFFLVGKGVVRGDYDATAGKLDRVTGAGRVPAPSFAACAVANFTWWRPRGAMIVAGSNPNGTVRGFARKNVGLFRVSEVSGEGKEDASRRCIHDGGGVSAGAVAGGYHDGHGTPCRPLVRAAACDEIDEAGVGAGITTRFGEGEQIAFGCLNDGGYTETCVAIRTGLEDGHGRGYGA